MNGQSNLQHVQVGKIIVQNIIVLQHDSDSDSGSYWSTTRSRTPLLAPKIDLYYLCTEKDNNKNNSNNS